MTKPTFTYQTSHLLDYHGDCALMGVMPDFTVYAEVLYDEEDWLAQYAITYDGGIQQKADEAHGRNPYFIGLNLPEGIIRPSEGKHTNALNYKGARHRGMRAMEPIQESVRSLNMQTKMRLVEGLNLGIMPPMVLGVAESYVLSEAEIVSERWYLVCRRVRIAYALPQQRMDSSNLPYDYDTLVMHIAHLYDAETQDTEVTLEVAFAGLPGVDLLRPMDCVLCDDHIFVADGGDADRKAAVHIWRVGQ